MPARTRGIHMEAGKKWEKEKEEKPVPKVLTPHILWNHAQFTITKYIKVLTTHCEVTLLDSL